jgi:NADPH:quinone reductase-like Zn-dependent oxidoreductase
MTTSGGEQTTRGSERMRAVVATTYGSPDVLRADEVTKPTPADDEVLVRVRATVVGPLDSAAREGTPPPNQALQRTQTTHRGAGRRVRR